MAQDVGLIPYCGLGAVLAGSVLPGAPELAGARWEVGGVVCCEPAGGALGSVACGGESPWATNSKSNTSIDLGGILGGRPLAP